MIDSPKVISILPAAYQIPDPLPWAQIVGPLAAAEDQLARLDERLAKSPIRDGFIARTHFTEACASLWLSGELVHLEDLVLHDARMDVRAPTHELTQAHAVLRTRRRIADAEPGWPLSPSGLDSLRGRKGRGDGNDGKGDQSGEASDDETVHDATKPLTDAVEVDEQLISVFAAVDAAIAQADRVLAGAASRPVCLARERDPLVYDVDRDEASCLDEWRAIVEQTRTLPPTFAAAIAMQAWVTIEPLQRMPWLGQLLAASLLRERGKSRWHLPCLNEGLKAIPRERRRPRDASGRLVVQLEAIAAAGTAGLKDHDRWLAARSLLARKLDGRRSTSRLPALLDYVLSCPIVSANMIARELSITPRAAQDLVGRLGLREATGRGRYRAWGVL